jgi:hypothetical protein
MSSKPERFSAALRAARELAPALVLVSLLAAASRFAFPDLDDAYLLLILKERGAEGVAAGSRDRFLVSWLWSGVTAATGNRFWDVALGLHVVLWIGLAAVAARLARFASSDRWSPGALAGLLAVAPLAVRTQLSIGRVSEISLLPTVLAWAAVLMLLAFARRGGTLSGGAGFGLLAVAILYSEYAVPVALCGTALLLFADGFRPSKRRIFLAVAVLAWAGAFYLIYRALGDATFRPDVNPADRASARGLLTLPLAVASIAWRLTIGGLGGAAERFAVGASRPSLAGAAFGILLGFILLKACRELVTGQPPNTPASVRRAAIWLALAAGLVPVAFMRGYTTREFSSRFYFPLVPVAAVLTAGLIAEVPDGAWRRGAIFVVGLVVGAFVVQMAADAYHRQRLCDEIGAVLRPIAEARTGLVVAVVDSPEVCATDLWCTGQITRSWPGELTQRVWIFPPERGRTVLGSRAAAPGADMKIGTQILRRPGRTADAIWIGTLSGALSLEPYWLSR